LEAALAAAYSLESLAAMVYERYPATPYVKDYARTIGEAVEAHHLGLRHVAVIGLMPVIEGAGRRLADSRSVKAPTMKSLFPNLARDCKNEILTKNIGDTQEIISMFESFEEFTDAYLYINSALYPLDDKTNRHGTLHGAYADSDFGDPISFYKAIGSIDFLCMVAALSLGVLVRTKSNGSFATVSALLSDLHGLCRYKAGVSSGSPDSDQAPGDAMAKGSSSGSQRLILCVYLTISWMPSASSDGTRFRATHPPKSLVAQASPWSHGTLEFPFVT
jgi:hypothetical protein